MSALIEEFKKEHSEIVDALNEVKELGVLTEKGQTKLMSVKAALFEHLKNEDEQLYPVLRKEAEQNKKLKEDLAVFAKELVSVSRVVFGFFDRFTNGVLGARLLGDFETLFMVLRYRMGNEENFLYAEYEKIVQ
jgi:hypothetical protein